MLRYSIHLFPVVHRFDFILFDTSDTFYSMRWSHSDTFVDDTLPKFVHLLMLLFILPFIRVVDDTFCCLGFIPDHCWWSFVIRWYRYRCYTFCWSRYSTIWYDSRSPMMIRWVHSLFPRYRPLLFLMLFRYSMPFPTVPDIHSHSSIPPTDTTTSLRFYIHFGGGILHTMTGTIPWYISGVFRYVMLYSFPHSFDCCSCHSLVVVLCSIPHSIPCSVPILVLFHIHSIQMTDTIHSRLMIDYIPIRSIPVVVDGIRYSTFVPIRWWYDLCHSGICSDSVVHSTFCSTFDDLHLFSTPHSVLFTAFWYLLHHILVCSFLRCSHFVPVPAILYWYIRWLPILGVDTIIVHGTTLPVITICSHWHSPIPFLTFLVTFYLIIHSLPF